jgi:hypothetical protein
MPATVSEPLALRPRLRLFNWISRSITAAVPVWRNASINPGDPCMLDRAANMPRRERDQEILGIELASSRNRPGNGEQPRALHKLANL